VQLESGRQPATAAAVALSARKGARRADSQGRRAFLRRLALGAAGTALAPALLQACGGRGGSGRGGGSELLISNFPLYIDTGSGGSVARFRKDTGIRVRYLEDVNDAQQAFARMRPQLAAGQPLAQDLVVLPSWMAARLIRLGWLDPLPLAAVPNASRLIPSLHRPAWDPEQRFTLPWQTGIAGIAYNIRATGRELHGIDDLFDPALKGRVSALLEMHDTMALLMLADGQDIRRPTWAGAQPAFERLERARRDGQIRRFTGNDYQKDLLAGNLAACMGWSGDVAQLALEEPDLRFVVPESGGVLWADVMLMPKGARHRREAAAWMNWVYDPVQAARIAAAVQYISPVAGVQAILARDPATAALAGNRLMFPDAAMLERLHIFGPLDDVEQARWEERFARITEA